MKKPFISPLLIDYDYIEDLCREAGEILGLKLGQQAAQADFRLSIFLNFNRYLALEIGLMPDRTQNGIYEELTEQIKAHQEKKTIDLLASLEILPKARQEFLDIIKDLKKNSFALNPTN
jgi:hypothetical protein